MRIHRRFFQNSTASSEFITNSQPALLLAACPTVKSDRLLDPEAKPSLEKMRKYRQKPVETPFLRADQDEMAVKLSIIQNPWDGFAFSSLNGLLSPTGC